VRVELGVCAGKYTCFHRTFKVRAGQIVKQHFEFRLEQVGPLLPQPREKFLFMFEHAVQAAVQAVFLRYSEIRFQ